MNLNIKKFLVFLIFLLLHYMSFAEENPFYAESRKKRYLEFGDGSTVSNIDNLKFSGTIIFMKRILAVLIDDKRYYVVTEGDKVFDGKILNISRQSVLIMGNDYKFKIWRLTANDRN